MNITVKAPRATSKKNAAINRIAQGSAMFNGMNARDRATLRALLAVAYSLGKADAEVSS